MWMSKYALQCISGVGKQKPLERACRWWNKLLFGFTMFVRRGFLFCFTTLVHHLVLVYVVGIYIVKPAQELCSSEFYCISATKAIFILLHTFYLLYFFFSQTYIIKFVLFFAISLYNIIITIQTYIIYLYSFWNMSKEKTKRTCNLKLSFGWFALNSSRSGAIATVATVLRAFRINIQIIFSSTKSKRVICQCAPLNLCIYILLKKKDINRFANKYVSGCVFFKYFIIL